MDNLQNYCIYTRDGPNSYLDLNFPKAPGEFDSVIQLKPILNLNILDHILQTILSP